MWSLREPLTLLFPLVRNPQPRKSFALFGVALALFLGGVAATGVYEEFEPAAACRQASPDEEAACQSGRDASFALLAFLTLGATVAMWVGAGLLIIAAFTLLFLKEPATQRRRALEARIQGLDEMYVRRHVDAQTHGATRARLRHLAALEEAGHPRDANTLATVALLLGGILSAPVPLAALGFMLEGGQGISGALGGLGMLVGWLTPMVFVFRAWQAAQQAAGLLAAEQGQAEAAWDAALSQARDALRAAA